MNEEYKGIYFDMRNSNNIGPSKKYYEHGAHFEYKKLYLILEKLSKRIKFRINSSIPKKKNISPNKKRQSSCKKKSNKQKNLKLNLSYFYMTKKRKIDNKKIINNNSLIIKEKEIKKLSFGKNKNNSFNNIIMDINNFHNKKYYKYNSSIINNSMENFYSDIIFNLNNSLNSEHKENENKFNNTIINKTGKKNLKFNAYALSDFGKKNDNIIFSFNKKIKKDKSEFLNKYKYENEFATEKNKNLITKENKNKSITTIDPINLSQQILNEEKHKLNKSDINNIKSENYNNYDNKTLINAHLNNSFLIKGNYPTKTDKNKNVVNNKPKKIVVKRNFGNNNKTSISNYLKMEKSSKNKGKPKLKLSRNKEYLKTKNSLLDLDKTCQLSLYNFKYNSLIIKNETQKINSNINNSDIMKEKKDKMNRKTNSMQSRYINSMEKRDIKKYIKNKLLEQNKLNFYIKNKINCSKNNDTIKNVQKINKNKIKNMINFYHYKKDNNYCSSSTKSNNDSINKSKSNKNGDKKSIISTNLTSHINSRGIIIPLLKK